MRREKRIIGIDRKLEKIEENCLKLDCVRIIRWFFKDPSVFYRVYDKINFEKLSDSRPERSAISSVCPANAISPFGSATRKRPINKYPRVINWIAIRQDERALLNFHRGSP